MLDDENRGIDLLAHLHLITAVDEDRGAIGEHDRRAGRAGEAGEPGEPLVRRRHVFALEAVGVRHDEAVEPAPLQFRAQRGDVRGAAGAAGAILERLEMRFEHAR